MTVTWITAIGLLAATFTTISFLPQVIKTWRSKSAGDLSLVMYAILCTGVLLWAIYGIIVADLPIILGNVITLALAGSILYFIIKDRPSRTDLTEKTSGTEGTSGPDGHAAPPPDSIAEDTQLTLPEAFDEVPSARDERSPVSDAHQAHRSRVPVA